MGSINPKELYKNIQRIKILSSHLATDFFAGAYRSVFKGRGLEFEEVREYIPGDDIRTIDWKVTARLAKPHVKLYREEREITVMLCVDLSASTRFGGKNRSKKEIMAEVAAVLAFSAIENSDRVGALLFSEKPELYIPPRKGTRHVLHVIRELLAYEPKYKKTNLSTLLNSVGNVIQKRCILIIISDFICEEEAHLMTLLSKKHNLITIRVLDPYEMSLPNFGLVQFVDLETGEICPYDSNDPKLIKTQKDSAQSYFSQHETLVQKIGAGHIDLRTDQPYIPELKRFFQQKKRKKWL